nr:EOG090X027U [Triops cancriformis]
MTESGIFKDLKYVVTDTLAEEAEKILNNNGAKKFQYGGDHITHYIAGDDPKATIIDEARDIFEKPVVTQSWVILSQKCGQLLPISGFQLSDTQLFSKVVVCPTQLTKADVKAIFAIVLFHGGKAETSLTSSCTHLIAGKAAGTKYEAALKHLSIKIVTPDWITDCLNKKAKQSEEMYHPNLLITPPAPAPPPTPAAPIIPPPENISANRVQETKPAAVPFRPPPVAEIPKPKTYGNQAPPAANPAQPQQPVQVQTPTRSVPKQQQPRAASLQMRMPSNLPPHLQQQFQFQTQARGNSRMQQQLQQQQQQQQPQQQQQSPVNVRAAAPQIIQVRMQHQQQMGQQNLTVQNAPMQQGQAGNAHMQAQGMQQLQNPTMTSVQNSPMRIHINSPGNLHIQNANPNLGQQVPQRPPQLSTQQIGVGLVQQQQQQSLSQNPNLPNPQQTMAQNNLNQNQQQGVAQGNQVAGQQLAGTPNQPQGNAPSNSPQIMLNVNPGQQQQFLVMQRQGFRPQVAGQPVQRMILMNGPNGQQVMMAQQRPQGQMVLQQVNMQNINTANVTSGAGNTTDQQLGQAQPVIQSGQIIRSPGTGQIFIQQGQRPVVAGQAIVRQPITWQQQQLQLQLQKLDPQTRQQLQQMTPQMRGVVLQRLLQQEQQARQRMAGPQQQQQQPGLVQGQLQQVAGNEAHPQPQQIVLRHQVPGQPPQQLQVVRAQLQQVRAPMPPGAPPNPQAPQQIQRLPVPVPTVPSPAAAPPGAAAPAVNGNANFPVTAEDKPILDDNGVPQVNPKTKTALANLLNTRLQGGGSAVQAPLQAQVPPAVAQQAPQQAPVPRSPAPVPSAQQQMVLQRKSLQNITNAAGTPTTLGAVPGTSGQVQAKVPVGVAGGATVVMSPHRIQFFGHDPNLKLPPDVCLLGCIFFITDQFRDVSPKEITTWKQVIAQNGGEVEPAYCPRVTHVVCEHIRTPVVQQALREGKRLVTCYWLNDVIAKQHMAPPSQILHVPTPFGEENRPCKNMVIAQSGFENEERIRVQALIELLGAKYTAYFSRHNSMLVCRKAEGTKYQKAREWRKPVVTVQWLHEVYCGQTLPLQEQQQHHPKYQNFHSENPRRLDFGLVPHLMAAWKVPIRITQESYEKFKNSPPKRVKRKLSIDSTGTPPASSPLPTPAKKKARPSEDGSSNHNLDAVLDDVVKAAKLAELEAEAITSGRPSVRFSGIEAAEQSELSAMVSKLGGVIANTNKDASHLIMSKLQRTAKLLCCLPFVKHIVTPRWLVDSLQAGKFLDEEPYVLKDEEFDSQFNCNIAEVLLKPKRDQLFKGKTFWVSPGVCPSRTMLQEIIEASGGVVEQERSSLKSVTEKCKANPKSFLRVFLVYEMALSVITIFGRSGYGNALFLVKSAAAASAYSCVKYSTRLAEVGKLGTPKLQGKYDTGQLFLHRIFGYRGVVLFPWSARVYDRDASAKKEDPVTQTDALNVGKDVKGKSHTYYQVLIDSRDCPYIRAQTEAVTFLGNQENSRSLYAIPGLDYVAHEDILPYATTERQPLMHELFDKFLMIDPEKDPPYSGRETLRAWQEKNHPWLALSDVHKETTENVRVTVIPFYMGCRESQNNTVYWVLLQD